MEILYGNTKLAHSRREPTSVAIRGADEFLYGWRNDRGIDIVVFSPDPPHVRLFRYNEDDVFRGPDVSQDIPSLVGDDAISAIWNEYKSRFSVL